jgi:hypothetical protein
MRMVIRSGPRNILDTWVGKAGSVAGTTYLAKVRPDSSEPLRLLAKADLLPLLLLAPERWRDNVMLNTPSGTISRLVLKTGTKPIELYRERPKDPWQMVKPMRTRAKSENVEAVLKALASMKVTSIEAQTTAKAPELRPDQRSLTVHSAQLGGAVELVLSPLDAKEPGKAMLTSSHRHGTFTVSGENLSALWWGVTELRDDRIIDADLDHLEQMEITGGPAGDVALRKEGDLWSVRLKGEWQSANDKRVRRLFEQIQELSVLEFVSDSASGLEEFGLVKPYLILRWSESDSKKEAAASSAPGTFAAAPVIGTQTALQLGLGKEGNVYGKLEDRPFVFRVPATILDLFPKDHVRWKSLMPLRFSPFSLRRITLAMGARPPVVLDYDPLAATWSGSSAGQSITAMIDGPKADMLAGKLGNLSVNDWLQNRSDAIERLANPAITVGISLLSEMGNVKSAIVEHTLSFSPAGDANTSALFYGRLDRSPDVFLMTRTELLQLVGSSVFKAAK